MQVPALIVCLVFTGSLLIGDWESDVNAIRDEISHIDGNVSNMASDLGSIWSWTRNINVNLGQIGILGAAFDMTRKTDGAVGSLYFLEQQEGRPMYWKSNGEIQNKVGYVDIGTGYDSMLSMKKGYKDRTQDYIDLVWKYQNSNISMVTDKYKMSDYANGSTANYTAPDTFLDYGRYSDLLVKDGQDLAYGPLRQQTKSQYMTDEGNKLTRVLREELAGKIDSSYQHVMGSGMYNGLVLQWSFAWVPEMVRRLSNNKIMLTDGPEWQTVYGISLRPSEGDWIWPVYQKWHQYDSIINAVLNLGCFGSVMLFLYLKIKQLMVGDKIA